MSLGDIRYVPTRRKFAIFHGFLPFWSNAPKIRSVRGGGYVYENLKHVVSTACRPRVFQIALLKGFPNIPHINPPFGTLSGHK